MAILGEYVEAAMKHASCERLEDGTYFCAIEGLKGPYGAANSKRAAAAELREVLEEWLVAALRDDDDLPEFGGVSLNFGGKRWQDPSLVASSSSASAP